MVLSMIVAVVVVVVMEVVAVQGDRFSGKVLLVSMDGFRWDYVDISGLTNFTRLAATGVTADYVNNLFTTKTFPSHYTIVTGLYEESHGIVANTMYDPVHNATFTKASTEPFWWNGGEPIWVTAIKQNKTAAAYFWPGSEAEIRGYRPSRWTKYNQSVPFDERVATAVGKFTEENMDFVALYFHEPDATGHIYGPDSPEVVAKVREMDAVLGNILNTIDAKGLKDTVNVIVTSDHGMTSVDPQNRAIDLWTVVDRSQIQRVIDSNVVTALIPAEGHEEEVLARLQNLSHVTAYRKQDIPERFHYKNNPRIMPIIVVAEEGWQLTADIEAVRKTNEMGDHGYNNDLMTMKPIFFARGPDFQSGVRTTSIQSVDIYPLLCKLLNIKAAPNNGSLSSTALFLRSSPAGSASRFLADRRLADFLLFFLTVLFTVDDFV